MRNSPWFVLITALFVTCLITANIIAVKLVNILGLIVPAAVIIFPISYVFGDVLTEVYGYAASRRVIWLGFFCNLLAVIAIWIGGLLPAASLSDEPASVPLQRIRAEREKVNEGRRRRQEFAPLNTSDLPELPEGWMWTPLSMLGELARGKSKHRPRDEKHLYGGRYPFIQTGEIARANGLIKTYSQTYSEFGLAQSRLWPKGTMCITIAANIGDTAILDFDACFPDSVVSFIADARACTVQYIEYFMRTAKDRLEQFAPATAQKNINLSTLQKLYVPLAPLAEQHRIVAKIESLFAQAVAVERAVEIARLRVEKIDQAILARAFRGELWWEIARGRGIW